LVWPATNRYPIRKRPVVIVSWIGSFQRNRSASIDLFNRIVRRTLIGSFQRHRSASITSFRGIVLLDRFAGLFRWIVSLHHFAGSIAMIVIMLLWSR
jgi:hypothetical protein